MSRSVSLVRTEAPAAETGAGIRVPLWDGLRGMAILMALFFNFTTYLAQWTGGSNQTALLSRGCVPDGLAGVALFFILSGYLILVDSVGRGLALGSSPSPGANNWLNRVWAVRGSPRAPRSSWSPPFSRERPGPNWSRRGSELTAAAAASCAPWLPGPGCRSGVHRSARDAHP